MHEFWADRRVESMAQTFPRANVMSTFPPLRQDAIAPRLMTGLPIDRKKYWETFQ